MFSKRTGNQWYFGYGFNMMVDFCIWTLESDGLHVPPFDRHSDGDGALRQQGLNAESWRAWLEEIVNLYNPRAARAQSSDGEQSSRVYLPPAIWTGEPAVGDQLTMLWQRYLSVSNLREDRMKGAERLERSKAVMNLWHDLKLYHKRLATLYVYFVDYPWPVKDIIPPVSVIQGIGSELPDVATFRTSVLHAAQKLAEFSDSPESLSENQ